MKLISVKFLIFLLLIDLSFIFLSFIHHQFDLSLNDFLVYNDGGYAEKFQYLKFIGIVMISFLIAIKRKSVPFLIFTIIPIYLFWDDSRLLHENFGYKIALIIHKGSPSDILIKNFKFIHIGEFFYMALVGFTLLMIYLLCLRLSDNKEKSLFQKILKLLLVYGFFAIILDFLIPFSTGSLNVLLSILEDGGEMIPISIICSYFFDKIQSNRNKKLLHF